MPVNVDLRRAPSEQRDVLASLMQLYVHDFSEVVGLEIGDDGRFAVPPLGAYWEDPLRHPFFIRADGHLAGFALVHRGSRLTADADVWDMAEFFVLRSRRRAGVGLEAARQVFAAHPGKWEVRQRLEATAATAFWRRAIGRYVGGAFTEVDLDDARWRGPVQRFTS